MIVINFKKMTLKALNEKINWSDYPDSMVQSGVKLMKEINDAGYEAYIVGGAVRDIAMGRYQYP